MLAFYRLLKNTEMNNSSLDFIFLYWFAVNFAFFTYYHIKVDRYFMPMLPFFAYFIMVSIELIFDKLKSWKNIETIKTVAPIALVCLILLFTGICALNNAPHTFDNQMHPNFWTAASEEKAVGAWLMEHDPDYKNKTIWADRGGDMTFILRTRIPSVEQQSYESDFTDNMTKHNVTYYISKDNKTIGEPYIKLYQNGEVSLYCLKPDK